MKKNRASKIPHVKVYIPRLSEREITKQIRDYLKYVPECHATKMLGTLGMRDVLDLVICYRGKYIELEVKTTTGKLTDGQKERIEKIRRAGGIAEVVRSVDDVDALFKSLGYRNVTLL